MNTHVQVKDGYITLGKLLKLVNLVSSGGQAKMFLSANTVKVNGIPVKERGKKLFPGAIVSLEGHTFTIGGDTIAPAKPEN